MSTVEVAHVSHGRTDDHHDWQVHIDEVSLWRLMVSQALLAILHRSGLCCSGWAWWPPFVFVGKAGHRLVNWAARLDNGWLHRRYTFKVDDAWVKKHATEFWADMHDLYREEDAAASSMR